MRHARRQRKGRPDNDQQDGVRRAQTLRRRVRKRGYGDEDRAEDERRLHGASTVVEGVVRR